MTTNIKTIAIAYGAVVLLLSAAGWWLYDKGYDDAVKDRELAAQQGGIKAQKEVGDSNVSIQEEKLAHFESLLRDRDQRVRELEAKLRADQGVESTCDDRNRALRIAVELEGLAAKALGHLEAERKR